MSRLTDIIDTIRDSFHFVHATPERIELVLHELGSQSGYATIHDRSGQRVGVLLHAMDFDKLEGLVK